MARDRRTTGHGSTRIGAVLLAVLLLVSLAGCGGHPVVTVMVTPDATRADDPMDFRVTGAPPSTVTELEVTSTDASGRVWSSRAVFTTDGSGTVDVTTAASSGGSYLGVAPMGLIDSMRTADASSEPLLVYRPAASGPATFTLTARVGQAQPVSTTFTRTFVAEPLVTSSLTLQHDGFVGVYQAPAAAAERRPAVLIIGGSEGGNSGVVLAQALAARGIPALSVAYFGVPGLPQHLDQIPLEYFRRPLRWLAGQPAVDPHRVWVSGASYGSEAALLLGALYPSLVHGVASVSGGSTVTCSLTPGQSLGACKQAPWTRAGRDVPFTREFNNPAPSDVPAAVIGVERIKGPVLAVCGGADLEWNACQLSQAVLDRRRAHRQGTADLLLSYPDAGHYVDLLIPYGPLNPAAPDARGDGSIPEANSLARADAWPKILAFLSTH